jgi:hypothetical protein
MFWAAAAFNFAMGGPIFLASEWTYRVAYVAEPSPDAIRFWGDFGYAVLVIGAGYGVVAADVTRNHGIVWLGVIAKLFDVIALSTRCFNGAAHTLVLLPALIDALFIIAFLAFLLSIRKAMTGSPIPCPVDAVTGEPLARRFGR